MGKELSLFSNYQGENAVTNYCGLILKLLHDESPRQLEQLVQTLSHGNFLPRIGPIFSQQIRMAESTPDLFIHQQPFSILVETKLDDWYHKGQIERHINSLKKIGGPCLMLALCNFESDDYQEQFSKQFRSAIEKARLHNIQVSAISFEEFLTALKQLSLSENFRQTLNEFGRYLDGQGLLPKWKYLLDVVNCSQSADEIDLGAYICADVGGSYSHRRAKYLGAYTGDKKVTSIHEILGLVIIHQQISGAEVRWNNSGADPQTLIEEAKRILSQCQKWRQKANQDHPQQFFLLGPKHQTDFKKDTSGGMLHSKIYFRGIAKHVENAEELAKKLSGKSWSEFLK